MQGEIAYTKAPAADVFARIAPRIQEPFRSWVLRMGKDAQDMQSTEFGLLWENSVRSCLQETRLTKEELEQLSVVGRQLGGAGSEMQGQVLEWYARQFLRKEAELMEEMKEKQKLYRCLGVTAGIFLVLFFF